MCIILFLYCKYFYEIKSMKCSHLTVKLMENFKIIKLLCYFLSFLHHCISQNSMFMFWLNSILVNCFNHVVDSFQKHVPSKQKSSSIFEALFIHNLTKFFQNFTILYFMKYLFSSAMVPDENSVVL